MDELPIVMASNAIDSMDAVVQPAFPCFFGVLDALQTAGLSRPCSNGRCRDLFLVQVAFVWFPGPCLAQPRLAAGRRPCQVTSDRLVGRRLPIQFEERVQQGEVGMPRGIGFGHQDLSVLDGPGDGLLQNLTA